MDVPITPPDHTHRRVLIGIVVLGFAAALAFATTGLGSAVPVIKMEEVTIDTVRQGLLVRDIRAPGTLISEQVFYISAPASARIEILATSSGSEIVPSQRIVKLANPDLQLQLLQAEQQVRQSEMSMVQLQTSLRSQSLTQEGVLATAATAMFNASQAAGVADSLATQELVSRLELQSAHSKYDEMSTLYRIEKERADLLREERERQLAVQSAQISHLKSIAEFHRSRIASLDVRAPVSGVVQDLDLQPGQWVPEGTTIARLVQPGKLKAVLRIPEAQAKDIVVGLAAKIDTRNGVVSGRVSRVDPGAQDGVVKVDVELIGLNFTRFNGRMV